MNSPKLLPWIARRHGIARDRAEQLWRQAVALANSRFGEGRESSEYWAYTMQTLLKLAACEGTALVPADDYAFAATVGPRSALPIVHAQLRMGALVFDSANAFVSAVTRCWRWTLRGPTAPH